MKQLPPKRWRQIDELFDAALDRAPDERAAFLDNACRGDGDLLEQVQRLLDRDQEAADSLGESVTAYATPLIEDMKAHIESDPEPDTIIGQQLGPYRILEEIGRGGMGAVYLAERSDDQYVQRVALKLVKRGMDTDEILRRFRYERQILATLEHPNIARLYDGGVSDDGRPFLVMEYVEGRPVDRHCNLERLSIEKRLELFQTVCRAVEFAHQNLVVHRDLKPSNILVTSTGEVKLLDFGIAKLLDEESQLTAPITRAEAKILTPDYAAPEQIRGERVTTATDVFALGVLLYELLSGHRPPTSGSDDREPTIPSKAARKAAEPDDSRSSNRVAEQRRTTPAKLAKQLQGDLDRIVLTALHYEPDRRYRSASELLADLERHRDGLPVRAHRDTSWYRATKFVQRNRTGVVGAALILLALMGGLAGALYQAHRADRERLAAEQVSSFLEGLFVAGDPFTPSLTERPDTLRVEDLLDLGTDKVRDELEGQPEIRARLLQTIGRVYQSIGRFDQARTLLEEALAMRTETLSPEDRTIVATRTDLASILIDLGEFDLARSQLESARAATSRTGLGPTELTEILAVEARLEVDRGEYAKAEEIYRELLAVQRTLPEAVDREVAQTLHALCSLLGQAGRPADAEEVCREALAARRDLLGADHPGVAQTLTDLASNLAELSEYDEAESLHREALSIYRGSLGETHPSLAIALNQLAIVLQRKGEFAEAEVLFLDALEIRRQVYGERHGSVATGLSNLGGFYKQWNRYDDAERYLREAVDLSKATWGADHVRTASTTAAYAAVLSKKGDLEGAATTFEEAIAILRRTLDPNHRQLAVSLNNYGEVLRKLDRNDDARACFVEAQSIVRSSLGSDDVGVGVMGVNLALLAREAERFAEADSLYRDALAIFQERLPPGHVRTSLAGAGLGEVLIDRDQYDEAELFLIQALEELTESRGPEDALTARVRGNLISLYDKWGRPEEAARIRREANAGAL